MTALAALLLSAACAPAADTPAAAAAVDTAAAIQGLDALRNQYITLEVAGDAAGLAALHADSAGVDIFGLPRLRGRPAIQAAFTTDFAARKYTLAEIVPLSRNVRTNTDATEIGTYHSMHDVKGRIDHEWGRYIGAFTKGPDGQWRIAYVMAFPDSTKVDK
jgi:ketosteroid isomerase-like protein